MRRWGKPGIVGVALAAAAAAVVTPIGRADVPFPANGGDPYDYTQLHITNGSCDGVAAGERVPAGSDLPSSFDCRDTFKLSDYVSVPGDADYDPLVVLNPQELYGVRGASTNRAWEMTTGRPDVIIAVTDSGIRWDENRTNLVNKYYLNRGELPVPFGTAMGGTVPEYDHNGDGRFSVSDYDGDPRVVDDPDDENEIVDPGDLIRIFSDTVDDDGNGYVDDISGWDFFEGDNDPNDDVDYGHGTGESEDSAGEVGTNLNPQCPNCSLMEMRVGDSFVADANHFAEAAIYATDNGASIIQSALGTLNHTAFAQVAADYMYERGVLFVASAADEAAGHHNQPSALNHTMVVNSVTPAFRVTDEVPTQVPATWLALNGCTNFGGYIWLAVSSTSCSSDAVGQSAGIAGLVYSAARNAVELGIIEPDVSGQPLSAEEAKQVMRLGGEDIDFSTPQGGFPPNNVLTTLPLSVRYLTTDGWDQITGWGRLSALDAVALVAAGHIPPEADVVSPRWWEPLPAAGTVDIVGRVAAPRAESFTYEVQWAPGVQPPRWPLTDEWTVAASGSGTAPIEGALATLDLAEVRDAIEAAPPVYLAVDDPTSPDLPEQDAVRIRVVVHADGDTETPWRTAIEQRQIFVRPDATVLPGFPRFLGADGAASPAFEDLDGDGVDELVLADGNGLVHAFHADGTEAAGWPAASNVLPLPGAGDNAYTRGEVDRPPGAFLGGTPAIADLDGDGRPEVSIGDMEGNLYVWSHDGQRRAGFPLRAHSAYSEESACNEVGGPDCDDDGENDARDELNTVDHAWIAPPSVGDLDPTTPGLELVVGSNDGHVYAFHADGSPVAGWPVLLRDPAKVAAVDPVSHRVDYLDGSGVRFGRKINTTPTLGDVDGDGDLEVAVALNEEYEEPVNSSDPVFAVTGLLQSPGNTRVYLLHNDGTAHGGTAATDASVHPDDQAYVDGWPVPIAMLTLELLPYVGEGSNGSPVLADVDGDGHLEIMLASIASPPYVLRDDGSSFLGTDDQGRYHTMASLVPGVGSLSTDFPTIAALGGGAIGAMGGPGSPVSFVMGAAGLRRLLDVILPEQQLLAEDHIGAWDPMTGAFRPGFPAHMNDLQFFATPIVADVSGDGVAEVIQGSAMYDFRAYGPLGVPAGGWPHFTGGWVVATPGVGDLDGDGFAEVAVPTREGFLWVWRTPADACVAGSEWPKFQHDLRNSGTYGTDGRRPGPVGGVSVAAAGDGMVALAWSPAGDDGRCGTASAYEVVSDGAVLSLTETGTTISCASVIEVRAVDDVGQRGFPSIADVSSICASAAAPLAPLPTSLPATGGNSVWWPTLLVLVLAAAMSHIRRLLPPERRRG